MQFREIAGGEDINNTVGATPRNCLKKEKEKKKSLMKMDINILVW